MSMLDATKRFFFRGAQHGWASGNNGDPVRDAPGWSRIIYKDPEFPGFLFIDEWGRDPDSDKPSGNVRIMHFDRLAWAMWFGGGTYTKEAIPYLRRALMKNYGVNIFNAGRGPARFVMDEKIVYRNECSGNFERFSGTELIYRVAAPEMGSHKYWGGTFLFLNPNSGH